jgi:hypothetical protein
MPAMSTPVQSGGPYPLFPAPGDAYDFDGDIVVKHGVDKNWDGKPDWVYRYRRGSILRVDFDLDMDGEFDLRATYAEPAEGASNVRYRLVKIEDDYRLLPAALVSTYPHHNEFYLAGPPPRYEALVDGVWRGSFAIDLPLTMVRRDADAAKVVTRFVCEDGAAVSLTTEVRGGVDEAYHRTLFTNGRVSSYATGAGPERIERKIEYTYGQERRSVTRIDTDGDGELDYESVRKLPNPGEQNHPGMYSRQRLFYDLNVVATRIKIDGAWTDTFTRHNRRYVNGRLTEAYAPNTERVAQRFQYDEAGELLWAESDRDGDGVYDYRLQADGTLQKHVDGRWLDDFAFSRSVGEIEMHYTYRDGRQVRYEGHFPKEGRHVVFESPEPGVHIVKESSVFSPSLVWYYHAPEPDGAVDSLLRSAYDMDADDKPDVFVDYRSLTISTNKPADWPG